MAVVFDTETTGLIENRTRALSRQPEVIEFYGCLANLASGKIESEVEHLIRPANRIEDHTTVITGIREEDLRGKPVFEEVGKEIAALFTMAPVAIAHNATFDRDVLEVEAERARIEIKFPRLICTVEQTMHIRGHRLALGDLHEYLFGAKFEGAHRARHDVAALLKCCCELYKRNMI